VFHAGFAYTLTAILSQQYLMCYTISRLYQLEWFEKPKLYEIF